jgi:Putative addiction module component
MGLLQGRGVPARGVGRRYRALVGSDALYREAMHLSDDERATLAVRLLASVDEPAVDDSLETYTAWIREMEQRLDGLVSGQDLGEDWDDVHRELVAEYTVE